MKRWIKRTLLGLFGATVLFGGLAACSHYDRHCGHGWQSMSEEDAAKFKARMVDRIGGRLDLDEAQKAKLSALADKLREQRLALMAGGDPRAEFATVIAGTSFDRDKAKALIDAKTGAISARSPEVIAALADFYDSLKPEQQAKVRDFISRRGWRNGWHG